MAQTGASAPAPGPVKCAVGAYLSTMHDVDTASRTFKADVWLWSLCPTKDVEPLKTLTFVNAVDVSAGLDAQQQRGAQWWSTRKVTGTFRENFELESYPFDRHPLVIELEEGAQDIRSLVLVPDSEHSGLDPAIALPGWRINDFVLRGGEARHPTNFGDPSLPEGESRYSALHLIVKAERAHFATFVKLTIALYISAFMVLLSLLFDVSNTDLFIGRVGMHASALFAVVLNFVAAGQTVGHHESLSLLDEVHVVTLALILCTMTWSVFAYRAFARGEASTRVRRWDEGSAALFLALFLLANAALFATAVARGGENPPLYAAAARLHAAG